MSETESIERIKGAHELGLAFMRAAILLNSGALAVLLSYIASADTSSLVHFTKDGIMKSSFGFLTGITAIMIALMLSYCYTALAKGASLKHWLDTRIIPLNVGLSLVSLTAFVASVAYLVSTAGVKQP